MLQRKNSVLKSTLFFFVALLFISCSSASKELFFDIPPPEPETEAVEETKDKSTEAQQEMDQARAYELANPLVALGAFDPNAEPPAIESVMKWEEALELLPKDYKKNADWAEALEQGTIRLRGGDDPMAQLAKVFKYDFVIEAEKPKNEAYFPHSTHTEWLGCKNCHMTLYPYKRNPATMKEMRKGASCGTCHGKNNVAFSLTACKRCHLKR